MDQIDRWIQIGLKNPWIVQAYDPPLTRACFYECRTPEELKEKLEHGNWCLGTAFYYLDICFINQVDGGDEWLTIRHGIPFESISWMIVIRAGQFHDLLNRLLSATPEQCPRLEY
jgi:hypothetical protein